MKYYPVLRGLFHQTIIFWIPIKQPGFHGKYCFFLAQVTSYVLYHSKSYSNQEGTQNVWVEIRTSCIIFLKKWWKTGKPMFFILTGLSHYLFVWGAVGFVVLLFCCMLQGHDSLLFFFGGVGGRFTMVFLMGVTPPVIALGLPNTLASETVHLSRYDWKTTGMSIIHSNWVIIPR